MQAPPLVCSREALRVPPLVAMTTRPISGSVPPETLNHHHLRRRHQSTRPATSEKTAGRASQPPGVFTCSARRPVLAAARLAADSTQYEHHLGRDGCPGNDTSSDPPSPSSTWEMGSEPLSREGCQTRAPSMGLTLGPCSKGNSTDLKQRRGSGDPAGARTRGPAWPPGLRGGGVRAAGLGPGQPRLPVTRTEL